MDLAILQKIASELDTLLVGGFVNKIHQPLAREIVLRIRASQGGEKKLMISADPSLGRMHLTDMKIPNPPVPPRFCAYLRAHFQGSRIMAVRAAPDDRVVRIVGSRGPVGARTERELILELLGRDSNILLVDGASNVILECLHHIPEKETSTRVVLPAVAYVPPPPRAGRALTRSASEDHGEGLPAISVGPAGKKRLILGAVSLDDEVFPSMNAAANAFFRPKLESAMLDALKRQLAAPLKARVKSLERRLLKIQADTDRLKHLAEYQYDGELLKSSLARAKKGMDVIEVQDWTTGGSRIVALNPAITPVANMERMFQKAAKGKRGQKIVQERQSVTLQEKRAIEDILYYMETAEDVAALESAASGYGSHESDSRKAALPKARKDAEAESSLYHRFPISPTRAILVGKSAIGNDFLLRRKAKPNDSWLHVKDFPGAHVLLPAAPQDPPSSGDMIRAAACAVHFSKARDKGKVEVMVARCSDIQTIRGGLKGQVSVKKHSTIMSDGHLAEAPWEDCSDSPMR